MYPCISYYTSPLKFIYSEKDMKFCKISNVDLSYIVPVESMVEKSQKFVAIWEYMNFIINIWIHKLHSNLEKWKSEHLFM